jgi:hypothetical protein
LGFNIDVLAYVYNCHKRFAKHKEKVITLSD